MDTDSGQSCKAVDEGTYFIVCCFTIGLDNRQNFAVSGQEREIT